MTENLQKIQALFRDILDDDNLIVDENFSMEKCEDWDSVVTVQIVLGIERTFAVKFSTREVADIKSVADLLRKLS